MLINKYSDLIAWQKAISLVEEIYRDTNRFPKSEVYGLRAQIRRAAVSVPSNIAEGHARGSTGSFLNHLAIAYGSLCEVETQVVICGRLGFLTDHEMENIQRACSETGKLIHGLRKALRDKTSNP